MPSLPLARRPRRCRGVRPGRRGSRVQGVCVLGGEVQGGRRGAARPLGRPGRPAPDDALWGRPGGRGRGRIHGAPGLGGGGLADLLAQRLQVRLHARQARHQVGEPRGSPRAAVPPAARRGRGPAASAVGGRAHDPRRRRRSWRPFPGGGGGGGQVLRVPWRAALLAPGPPPGPALPAPPVRPHEGVGPGRPRPRSGRCLRHIFWGYFLRRIFWAESPGWPAELDGVGGGGTGGHGDRPGVCGPGAAAVGGVQPREHLAHAPAADAAVRRVPRLCHRRQPAAAQLEGGYQNHDQEPREPPPGTDSSSSGGGKGGLGGRVGARPRHGLRTRGAEGSHGGPAPAPPDQAGPGRRPAGRGRGRGPRRLGAPAPVPAVPAARGGGGGPAARLGRLRRVRQVAAGHGARGRTGRGRRSVVRVVPTRPETFVSCAGPHPTPWPGAGG